MTADQAVNQARSIIDQIANWLRWGIGILLAVALAVMVLEQYGIKAPFISVSSNVNTWAYLAGIYWLSR